MVRPPRTKVLHASLESPAPVVPDAVPDLPSLPIPRWSLRSVSLIILVWLTLHTGSLFSPGLLDDVDSVYLEIAREMLVRRDFVTPFVDGIRFFDKPPLMYWLAAGSMRLFGVHDWAGRLPLALLTLALLLATYALGLRLFARIVPAPDRVPPNPDRAALYAALALGTAIGPYLYTRFFIPDIVLTLWMTLGIHLFLIAVERAEHPGPRSALPPMLGFAAVLALDLLTKGMVGPVLLLAFALVYLVLRRRLALLKHLHLAAATAVFLLIGAPWHVLAALRNPAIPMPPGVGLPARAGWAWFYLYNEHIARFLSRRIPHDYGQVPIPLFWIFALLWIFPWVAFLPPALRDLLGNLRRNAPVTTRQRQTSLTLLLWVGLILGFFTLSARQEYYSLPALPALALMVGGLLARADLASEAPLRRSTLRWSLFALVPIGLCTALVAAAFAINAPAPPPGADIASLLARASTNPADYNLSLSHLADLSTASMGFFRAPLWGLALSMLVLGPGTYLVRRSGRTVAANLTLAAAAIGILLCIHAGLTRFYPLLGSKSLAHAILEQQRLHPEPDDLLLIDGELTSGSSLLFYTRQPAHLINGRFNGPWFGSFWPDAPAIFEDDASLQQLWSSPHRRIFLLTAHPTARLADLSRLAPTRTLATGGGKSILTNR